jgi:hypothetical protein
LITDLRLITVKNIVLLKQAKKITTNLFSNSDNNVSTKNSEKIVVATYPIAAVYPYIKVFIASACPEICVTNWFEF